MIYFLIYLAFGLPCCIAGAMINNDRPLFNRILFALMMLPLWPVFMFAMLREILTRRKVMTTCAWCGEVVAPITEWNNREVWVEHHRKCPNHPLKPERDAQAQRIAELEQQLEVACHVEAGDKEAFDWAALDKIFKLEQMVIKLVDFMALDPGLIERGLIDEAQDLLARKDGAK